MKKSFRFRYLGLIILGLFLISPLLVYASEPSFRLNKGVMGFFRIDGGSGVRVHDYEAFFNIVNNCSADLFIGNKTTSEWLSFWNNIPSCLTVTNRFCGDSICQTYAENVLNCATDCSYCGDGICDATENYFNCSADCSPICGDGICAGETCNSCIADCAGANCCGDGICKNKMTLECYQSSVGCPISSNDYCSIDISGGTATGYYNHCSAVCSHYTNYCESPLSCPGDCPACGDGFCNQSTGENIATCSTDCPIFCGDGLCNGSETSSSCIRDCKPLPILPPDFCGDGTCDLATEDNFNCPDDCFCGDGFCDVSNGESHATCTADCLLPFGCGDGICGCTRCMIDEPCPPCEDIQTCPQDCVANPPSACGNGVCQPGEPGVCFKDCGYPDLPKIL